MIQYQGVKQINKVILLKLTSRERPDILLETIKNYYELANNTKAMVWLFSFDYDCVCSSASYQEKIKAIIGENPNAMIVTGSSDSKIHAINRDVNNLEGNFKNCHNSENYDSHWDILLNISDDQRPIVKGYDDIIRNAMPDDLDASLWFSDGQPRINTQEIIGRKYYERFGYIYHPDFKSLWCDNLSTDLALFLGKCIRSKQQIIKHYHPAWGGSEAFKMDPLYERNNKYWNEDEATYKRLVAEGLDKLTTRQLA